MREADFEIGFVDDPTRDSDGVDFDVVRIGRYVVRYVVV
jgi:hypothetical protein